MTQQMNLQKGLVGHWTMSNKDSNAYKETFDSSLSSNWNTFGEQYGNISINDGELIIEQTEGPSGEGNTNIIGVRSSVYFPVGRTLMVRAKNTAGRHANLIGLTNGGSQPYPHGTNTGNPSTTLYSRADNLSSSSSIEDESGATRATNFPNTSYTSYTEFRMERPDSSTVEIYADDSLVDEFTGVDFGDDKQIYFSADGWKNPNRIVVDEVKVEPSKIYDRSGFDNHGTINGTLTTGTSGIINESYSFDATDDYISLSEILTDGLSKLTTSAWINPNNFKNNQCVYGEFGDPIPLAEGGNGSIKFYDGQTNHYSSGTFSTNEWTHIATIYDGSSSSVEFYVNGQLDSSDSGLTSSLSSYNKGAIGSQDRDGNELFDGQIDDVRLYNRTLSEDEINQLYQMREQKRYNI